MYEKACHTKNPPLGGGTAARVSCAAVVPCYNDGRFLLRALHALQQQQVPLEEILLVDDGSTDGYTAEVLRACAQEERVRLLRMVQNQGPAAARNRGIAASRADAILLLDADDSCEANFLSEAVTRLQAQDKVAVVGSYMQRYRIDFAGRRRTAGRWKPAGGALPAFLFMNEVNSCVLLRKAAWAATGGYDTQMRLSQDWEFWLRLTAAGWRVHIIPHYLHHYYVHGKNRSRQADPQTLQRLHLARAYIYQKHHTHYEQHFYAGLRHILRRTRYNPKLWLFPPPMLQIACRDSRGQRRLCCIPLRLSVRLWLRISQWMIARVAFFFIRK